MAAEYSKDFLHSVAGLLKSAQLAEDGATLAKAQASLDPQFLLEQQTTVPALLGEAAIDLQDTMRWIHAHPRVPRTLGGSAFKLSVSSQRYDALLRTPLLLSYDVGGVDQATLRGGYVFETPLNAGASTHPTMSIERRIVDERHPGVEEEFEGYTINVGPEMNGRRAVHISGKGFNEYLKGASKRASSDLLAFQRTHPEMNRDDPTDPHYAAYAEVLGSVLQLALSPPKIDYPDSLYYMPYGLLIQAQRQLAPKRKK